MSFFFGKREAVGSGTERKSSAQRSIHGVHQYSGRQLPPFFTFQSDTSPSLFSEYTIFARCSISSSFVERDRTLHQRSHQFLVLLLNAAHGHRQHYTKGKPNPHLHLLLPTNEMLFKSKTHIQSRIDSFHRRALLISPLPRITGPRNGRKDPTIYLQRNPLALHRMPTLIAP